MNVNLLPPNAMPLERRTARVCAAWTTLPVILRTLWQPQTCPLSLLPYLAWALSVDRWNTTWPASTKRQITQASFALHQRKGTVSALRQAVEPLGYHVSVQEWWACTPPDKAGTFRLQLSVLEKGITEATRREVERLIEAAKPLARHLLSLTLALEARGAIYGLAAMMDGETLSVYPYTPDIIISHGQCMMAGTLHLIDTLMLTS